MSENKEYDLDLIEEIGEYFRFVPNPEDENDKVFCIELLDVGKFSGVILKYDQIKVESFDEDTDEMALQFTYDIKYVPEELNIESLLESDKEFTEELLTKILLYILKKSIDRQDEKNEQD